MVAAGCILLDIQADLDLFAQSLAAFAEPSL